mmetsp:Transcript_98070/g.316226  ORF Transcript_98070/g.316226 Transcript_98070/m.316226 type:complete len:382 (-) Transcript_98070:1265-2410(-)
MPRPRPRGLLPDGHCSAGEEHGAARCRQQHGAGRQGPTAGVLHVETVDRVRAVRRLEPAHGGGAACDARVQRLQRGPGARRLVAQAPGALRRGARRRARGAAGPVAAPLHRGRAPLHRGAAPLRRGGAPLHRGEEVGLARVAEVGGAEAVLGGRRGHLGRPLLHHALLGLHGLPLAGREGVRVARDPAGELAHAQQRLHRVLVLARGLLRRRGLRAAALDGPAAVHEAALGRLDDAAPVQEPAEVVADADGEDLGLGAGHDGRVRVGMAVDGGLADDGPLAHGLLRLLAARPARRLAPAARQAQLPRPHQADLALHEEHDARHVGRGLGALLRQHVVARDLLELEDVAVLLAQSGRQLHGLREHARDIVVAVLHLRCAEVL